MKYAILIFCLLFVNAVFAQVKKPGEDLGSQLKQLVAAERTNFKSIRSGSFTKESDYSIDSIYSSKIRLEGTHANLIHIDGESSFYVSLVSDSLKASETEELYRKYEKKLDELLGKTYDKHVRTINDNMVGVGEELHYIFKSSPYTHATIVLSRLWDTDEKKNLLRIYIRKP